MTTDLDPAVYTVAEVCRLLSAGRRQVYEMIGRGELPGVIRINRSIRVSRAVLMSWINAGAGNGNGEAQPTGGAPDSEGRRAP